jgi:hypothetical protein
MEKRLENTGLNEAKIKKFTVIKNHFSNCLKRHKLQTTTTLNEI